MVQRESARNVLIGLLLGVWVLTGCPKARLEISVDLYREDPMASRVLTPGDMLEIQLMLPSVQEAVQETLHEREEFADALVEAMAAYNSLVVD